MSCWKGIQDYVECRPPLGILSLSQPEGAMKTSHILSMPSAKCFKGWVRLISKNSSGTPAFETPFPQIFRNCRPSKHLVMLGWKISWEHQTLSLSLVSRKADCLLYFPL